MPRGRMSVKGEHDHLANGNPSITPPTLRMRTMQDRFPTGKRPFYILGRDGAVSFVGSV